MDLEELEIIYRWIIVALIVGIIGWMVSLELSHRDIIKHLNKETKQVEYPVPTEPLEIIEV